MPDHICHKADCERKKSQWINTKTKIQKLFKKPYMQNNGEQATTNIEIHTKQQNKIHLFVEDHSKYSPRNGFEY